MRKIRVFGFIMEFYIGRVLFIKVRDFIYEDIKGICRFFGRVLVYCD